MSTQSGGFRSRHFISVPLQDGLLADFAQDQHPTTVWGWGHLGTALAPEAEGTHFGFVIAGPASLSVPTCGKTFELAEGMYFSAPGPVRVSGGKGVVITRLGFAGMFSVGGPIEQHGRLRYIDGCSDSLLIPPVIKGDPCLNHLHFPARIEQTRHTYPSIRVGIVARGKGRCVVPANDDGTGPDVTVPLVPGNLFVIPTDGQHSFFTDDEVMDVIAYHPDSDTGPDHDDHPMVNRTIVGGVAATRIAGIRTVAIG